MLTRTDAGYMEVTLPLFPPSGQFYFFLFFFIRTAIMTVIKGHSGNKSMTVFIKM